MDKRDRIQGIGLSSHRGLPGNVVQALRRDQVFQEAKSGDVSSAAACRRKKWPRPAMSGIIPHRTSSHTIDKQPSVLIQSGLHDTRIYTKSRVITTSRSLDSGVRCSVLIPPLVISDFA